MNIRLKYTLLFFFSLSFTFSQQDETLLTIDDENIKASEFLDLYNKNLYLVKDTNQTQIDDYLKLFVNYKLKIKEAQRLGFGETQKFKKEFSKYKKQLVQKYISDTEVTDALIKEAYDRLRYDIKASHILIKNNTTYTDTLKMYNELLGYRKTLLEDGFETAKEKYHNGTTILVEDLGFFSAFKMVYDFETAAYNTQPGKVSMPFKTDFGYHIVKVDEKKPSLGKITVAHIMISLQQKDSLINPKQRVDDIYRRLQKGELFEDLAKQFSNDKASAAKGGVLRTFKSGQLNSAEFENAAFNLKQKGDYTKPIKTDYGWHIIKLIEKQPLKSFEELKFQLANQVKRDSRSKLVNSKMAEKLAKKYTLKKNPNTKTYFNEILKPNFFVVNDTVPSSFNEDDFVISINNSNYTNKDFLKHLKSKKGIYRRKQLPIIKIIDQELKLFYQQSILNYREINLGNENKEFANALKEYREGLMLFDLMQDLVWNKASKDTLGLKSFYTENAKNYQWDKRIDAKIASVGTQKMAQKTLNLLRLGKTQEAIEDELKNDNGIILFTSGLFEETHPKMPKDLELKEGVSKIYKHNGGYHVITINAILPSTQKNFDEARGSIINDYQNHIENTWINALRMRYQIKVNQDVLKRIKSKIKQ